MGVVKPKNLCHDRQLMRLEDHDEAEDLATFSVHEAGDDIDDDCWVSEEVIESFLERLRREELSHHEIDDFLKHLPAEQGAAVELEIDEITAAQTERAIQEAEKAFNSIKARHEAHRVYMEEHRKQMKTQEEKFQESLDKSNAFLEADRVFMEEIGKRLRAHKAFMAQFGTGCVIMPLEHFRELEEKKEKGKEVA